MPEYELPATVERSNALLSDVHNVITDLNKLISVLQVKIKSYSNGNNTENRKKQLTSNISRTQQELTTAIKTSNYQTAASLSKDLADFSSELHGLSASTRHSKLEKYTRQMNETKHRLRMLMELQSELEEHSERLEIRNIKISDHSPISALLNEISDVDD
jgi:hypothetical protein